MISNKLSHIIDVYTVIKRTGDQDVELCRASDIVDAYNKARHFAFVYPESVVFVDEFKVEHRVYKVAVCGNVIDWSFK